MAFYRENLSVLETFVKTYNPMLEHEHPTPRENHAWYSPRGEIYSAQYYVTSVIREFVHFFSCSGTK